MGEELAPALIAEYKKRHPGVVFDLESKGTGYGFGNLIVGAADIAAASRPIRRCRRIKRHRRDSRRTPIMPPGIFARWVSSAGQTAQERDSS